MVKHENQVELYAVHESIIKHLKIAPLVTTGHKPVWYVWLGVPHFAPFYIWTIYVTQKLQFWPPVGG